jgi:hypothetical protein
MICDVRPLRQGPLPLEGRPQLRSRSRRPKALSGFAH